MILLIDLRFLYELFTNAWIPFLRRQFETLITIPLKEVLQFYMPEIFKKLLPNVTVIVDCTEFEMEQPSSLDSPSACYLPYKSRIKSLLGITPSDVLRFVSDLFLPQIRKLLFSVVF